MAGRSLLGLSFRAFAPLCGLSLWVACSTEPNDFFGAPNGPAGTSSGGSAGSFAGVAGMGSNRGGTGGTHAGSGNDVGGSSANGGSGNAPVGGSSNPGGGTTNNGGSGGTTPAMGGSGQGGTQPDAGVSGEGGAGENGTGGTVMGGEGGIAGEPTAGTGGTSGTGGTAGTGGTSGTGGTTAGTGGTGEPTTCADDGDCHDGQYCKKAMCNASTGACTERPTECIGDDATLDPVCGCDHMTYYTPCVAAREGVSVEKTGECTGPSAAKCTRTGGSGESCDPYHYRAACYRTRTKCDSTAAPDQGVCWVLPETCPDEDEAQLDCNNGDPTCRGLCEALEGNRPVIRDSTQCN